MLVDHLALMPTNSVFLARLSPWVVSLTDDQAKTLRNQASRIVKALTHAAGAMGEMVITPIRAVLAELESVSTGFFRDLAESISLSIRSSELVLDLYFECLEPLSRHLLRETDAVIEYFTRSLIGIVLDHYEEAHGNSYPATSELWQLDPLSFHVESPW
jgi:hypothetical protein